jgi:hypothetical protein
MLEVQRYTLMEVDREKHLARVARDGKPLGLVLQGVFLEAQFELGDGRGLLWLTEDSPYEEGLHIYLLGRDGGLEDAVEAGATFSPGLLELGERGEDHVEFAFFRNGVVYRLEVAREARFRVRLPVGWRYKRLWATHRLVVTIARQGWR